MNENYAVKIALNDRIMSIVLDVQMVIMKITSSYVPVEIRFVKLARNMRRIVHRVGIILC